MGATVTQVGVETVPPVRSGQNDAHVVELMKALKEPFDPKLVEWVVRARRLGKRGKQGLVVPYGDPRAYSDRLDALFTAAGWSREYSVEVVSGFERQRKGKAESFVGAKVLVVCKLTLVGLGTNSGTGEAWAEDDNALTAAEAQAFKRACSLFGLGRYFYDIPPTWVDLDEFDRPLWYPDLPSWALPQGKNGNGAVKNESQSHVRSNGKPQYAPRGNGNGAEFKGNQAETRNGNGVSRAGLLEEIAQLQTAVGPRVTMSIVQKVAGARSASEVRDSGKLTTIKDRLVNCRRGVERLSKAIAKIGLAEYAKICQELRVSGDVADLPDVATLRALVERTESVAAEACGADQKKASGIPGSAPAGTREAHTCDGTNDGQRGETSANPKPQ